LGSRPKKIASRSPSTTASRGAQIGNVNVAEYDLNVSPMRSSYADQALRSIPTLTKINYKPVDQFWKELEKQ
jgi:hypothetical protein